MDVLGLEEKLLGGRRVCAEADGYETSICLLSKTAHSVHFSCESLGRMWPGALFLSAGVERGGGTVAETRSRVVWGTRQDLASPSHHPQPRYRAPALPPECLLHLHVEDRFLVPVLPTIPDRQGVIAPLQVKLLEGKLDHLGREHGIREQTGAARRAMRTGRHFLVMFRCPESPWHHPTRLSIYTEQFHACILSVNYFPPGHTASGVP